MPQYNYPSLISSLVGTDVVLVWQTASGAVKTITGQDLATSLQSLMDLNDTVTVYANTTLLSNEQFVVANSGSNFTLSLPSAVSNPGKRFTIANKGAGILTVQRTGTDTIGGATSFTIAQYHCWTVESDGIGMWFQVSQ